MTETSEYYAYRNSNFVTQFSLKVRSRIYELFYQEFGNSMKIADVGVTNEGLSPEANVLETLYPHKERITAMGIEDADFLEKKFPGLKFVKIEAGKPLPFKDNEFDVVYSHAVIEHVVVASEREFFLRELLRIGKNVFLTTPNKYFPVEPHTFIPILHFAWPSIFYQILDSKKVNRFYNRTNLKLMTEHELEETARKLDGVNFEVKKVKLFGFVSNLILVLRKNSKTIS